MASRIAFSLRSQLASARTPLLTSRVRSSTSSIGAPGLRSPSARLCCPGHVSKPFLGQPLSLVRNYAVSERTHQPASKNVGEMGENARTEVKQAVGSILDAIGGEGGKHGGIPEGPQGSTGTGVGIERQGSSDVAADLKSLQGLVDVVPKGAIIFGAAGVIPYIATSATTIWFARQAWLADQGIGSSSMDLETALALLYHNETVQVTYGAVLLSFLGAIHWGFEFSKYGGVQGTTRYALGVAPAVLAWPTLLLPGQIALAAQWATFTAIWYIDMIATSRGWTPRYYSTYRFALTAVVGTLILLTLGASNYWSPSGLDQRTTADKLAQVKNRDFRVSEPETDLSHGPSSGVKITGKLPKGGDLKTTSDEEAFVRLGNAKEEREQKAQEEEKKR